MPLIGVDIEESETIDALVYARTTKLGSQGGQSSNVAKERAVQTRQQVKIEAASKASAAKQRMKQQVRSVDPESTTLTGNLPITNDLPVVEDVHEPTDASERTDEMQCINQFNRFRARH